MSEVDVITEIIIARPVEVVASFSADPENAPVWYENIKSVRWETAAGIRVGSRVTFTAQFLGRTLTYTYEISEWNENERLIMRTSQGPFPMQTTYSWKRLSPGSTNMTLRNQGTPTGFTAVVSPLVSIAMRRANRKDLSRLKAVLEGMQD